MRQLGGSLWYLAVGIIYEKIKLYAKLCTLIGRLGFDRDAKNVYVTELHQELSRVLPHKYIEEVTTASLTEYGKALSPINITFSGGESLEDVWKEISHKDDFIFYDKFRWPQSVRRLAFVHYYCRYAQNVLPLIRLIDVFTDVFYNPTKDGGTQAEPCAILKLLDQQNNLAIIDNLHEFVQWYEKYVII